MHHDYSSAIFFRMNDFNKSLEFIPSKRQTGKKIYISDLFKIQNALPLSKFSRIRTSLQNTCKQTHSVEK